EEDDKAPETTVTVEETEAEPVVQEAIEELPEEVRVVETISDDGKPKKKKIRTRVIKKVKGDKQEVTKIETVEEDDKAPETTVTVEESEAEPVVQETIEELPEEVRVVETISEDGNPKKKKIRTRVIKKVKGDKQEVTKIEIVEEDDKAPETTVTVEETEAEPVVQEAIEELPEEVRVVETISEDGKPKKKKIRTRVIKKVKGDKQEVTKIETVEEDDKAPETTVTVEESEAEPVVQEAIEELPEEVRVVETISEDGKPKKKKIRTRVIKKVKGDKQEVTKIETVEEDDKAPETTVTVEESKAEPVVQETIEELPEEVRVVETISEDGKPKKKKIRTRVIKKVKGDKQEVTKIETVEEDDKAPETTVTVEESEAEPTVQEVIEELPEEVRVVETISEDGKPKKKKIRTRVIKKVKGDKQEVTKIETVEEDDKAPETTVTVEKTDKVKRKKTVAHKGKNTKQNTFLTYSTLNTLKVNRSIRNICFLSRSLEYTITEPEESGADAGHILVKDKVPKQKKTKLTAVTIDETILGVKDSSGKPHDKSEEQNDRFGKFEFVELEPEFIQGSTSPTAEEPVKDLKKKRKLKLKTEQEENIIEIVEVSPEDADDQTFEVTVTSSEIVPEDNKEPKVLKKKVKRMSKKELDDFVAEIKEEPEQKFYETSMTDFYEVKLTELQPEIQSEEEKDTKPKKRRIRHEKGGEVEILEIVETVPTSGDQPLYEITVTSSEAPKEEGTTTQRIDKPKKKTKKMTKDELDAYIQQLINAEIPVTELEKYEKIDVDGKPKKPKKKKPKTEEKIIDEGETLQVGVTEHEPIEKPKAKKPKSKKIVQEAEAIETQSVPQFDEFTINRIDSERVPEEEEETPLEESVPALDEIIADLAETMPIVVVEEEIETVPSVEETTEIKVIEKTKKRKVKARKGSKQYEIEIFETQATDDTPEEAKVIVITTEITEDATDGPALTKPDTPKKSVRKIKRDNLKEYIVNVVEEAPQESIAKITEELIVVPDTEGTSDEDIRSFVTRVIEEERAIDTLPEEEHPEKDAREPKPKKKKPEKQKKVKISESEPSQQPQEPVEYELVTSAPESEETPQADQYAVEVKNTVPKPKKK
ncbi:hypothetical protein KR026_006804, partial [Drosophila bipectinata]